MGLPARWPAPRTGLAAAALWLLLRAAALAQPTPLLVPDQTIEVEPPPAVTGVWRPPRQRHLLLVPPRSLSSEPEPTDVAVQAVALNREGRRLLKAGQVQAGVERLTAAVAIAESAVLEPADLAEFHYVLAIALLRAEDYPGALVHFRRACVLVPNEALFRADMATAYLRAEEYDDAIATAELALRLHLTGEDADDTRALIARARSERLHSRLSLDINVSFGYDSNILEGGAFQTIAGVNTGAAGVTLRKTQGTSPSVVGRNLLTTYEQLLVTTFETAIPPQSQWDLPLNLGLELSSRLAGNKRLALWAGYHIAQTLMPSADVSNGVRLDHDSYNFQEQDLYLRLEISPRPWLDLRLKAEGFINFSGLVQFTPFQAGFNGSLDATFYESKRWRTLFSYKHNTRRSIDPADSSLNGDRDDVGLLQELVLSWFRGKLGYRFHSDRSGVLSTSAPYVFSLSQADLNGLAQRNTPLFSIADEDGCPLPPQPPPTPSQIASTAPFNAGCYQYQVPLSYQGHEVAFYYRFPFAHKITLSGSAHFERRLYADTVTAQYQNALLQQTVNAKGVTVQDPYVAQSPLIPAVAHNDSLISADVALGKKLPKGFSIEAGYALMYNLSTIANAIDNRNFTKHTVTLTTAYSF